MMQRPPQLHEPTVRLGIDVLLDKSPTALAGANIGLLTTAASVDARLTPVVDRLLATPGVNVKALFGPEHGLYGVAQAGRSVGDFIDEELGIPVYSLYGANKRPSPESLEGLDVLVIDLVDAGCRYWTFLYTMAYALEAAAQKGLRVIVLDRPNPITGLHVEGNLLDPDFASFVGLYPIPMRTGLTLGEAARLFNDAFGIGADLHVIACQGWKRSMWYDETGLHFVPPSPNAPSLDMITLYPGTCLLEGTNVSEGRGTTRPFELIGAPWIQPRRLAARLSERNLPGVCFRPVYFTPTFSKHEGQVCGGVQVHVTDRDALHAVRVGLHVLDTLIAEAPDAFEWLSPTGSGHPMIDLLAGTDALRLELGRTSEPDDLLARWEKSLTDFTAIAQKAALY